MDVLASNTADIQRLIEGVTGFVSYSLIRTADGGISVTVCQDKAGADESIRVAADWVRANAANTGAAAPEVWEGDTILHL
jgi:hypothetical protein